MLLPLWVKPRIPGVRHPALDRSNTWLDAIGVFGKGLAVVGVVLGERRDEHESVAVAARPACTVSVNWQVWKKYKRGRETYPYRVSIRRAGGSCLCIRRLYGWYTGRPTPSRRQLRQSRYLLNQHVAMLIAVLVHCLPLLRHSYSPFRKSGSFLHILVLARKGNLPGVM